jgi:Integrase core domain
VKRCRSMGCADFRACVDKPLQNAFIDIGRLRDELLNGMLFASLAHVREALMTWKNDCNRVRPYSPMGNLPPYLCSALPECNGLRALHYTGAPRPAIRRRVRGARLILFDVRLRRIWSRACCSIGTVTRAADETAGGGHLQPRL